MDEESTWALAAEAVAMEMSLFDQDGVHDVRSPTFRLLTGRIPVALSAPHSVRQPRRVAGAAGVLHHSEPYTGPLAIQLQRATGAWAIYATRTARADPNYAPFSTYKRHGLYALAARATPRLIIDLHGTRARDFAIAIGTSPTLREGRSQILINRISARLARALDGEVVVDPPGFRANNPFTVAAHCWAALGVPSVQIEISRAYRSPRQNPRAYAALYTALHSLIGELCTPEAAVDKPPR